MPVEDVAGRRDAKGDARGRLRRAGLTVRAFHVDEGFHRQRQLGDVRPHVEITRPAFEVALDVFQHSRLITKRHRYEDVVAPPPDAT